MDIKQFEYKAPISIDFNPLIHAIEKEKGYRYRDMGGRYSPETRAKQDAEKAKWLMDNGYEGKMHVLNSPVGSTSDWPKDSPEMALRVEINQKMRYVSFYEPQYLDVWHWMLDHCFSELRRGGINYMSISYLNEKPSWYDAWIREHYPNSNHNDIEDWQSYKDEDDATPDWVDRVLCDIFEACKDSEAFDGDSIKFHIDW